MEYTVKFYEDKKKRKPVEEFLLGLSVKARAKVTKSLEILQSQGVLTPYPHVSHVKDKLFELRVKQSKNQYRVIYFINTGRSIILLHGFVKTSRQIEASDIEISEKRYQDFIERYENENTK